MKTPSVPIRLSFLAAALDLCLLAALFPRAAAQDLQLQPGTLLQAAGATLDLGDYAIPCVTDWDGDGRKDLLAGYRYADKIAVLLNTGSDASPVLGAPANVQAGGADILHPSSGCGAPAPFVCDYDHDGKRDLLVGAGGDGTVHFYRNVSTGPSPVLASGVRLQAGAAVLSVGSRATPFAWDWNDDGLEDLLCGCGDGTVLAFLNTGTAQAPALAPGFKINAAGTDLNLGVRSVVRMLDWDEDGVADLVGSSTAGVYWCKNHGTRSAPVLAAPVPLRAPAAPLGLAPVNTGPRMRLELCDWNHDSAPDVLVGNADGTVSLYEGFRFRLDLRCAPHQPVSLTWNSAPYLVYEVLAGSSPDRVTNSIPGLVSTEGRTTCWTNPPGQTGQFFRVRVAP